MTLSRWRKAAKQSLLKLKPVTFRYEEELDSERTPQFGLIAEQVEKVCPDLVVRDDDGQVTTVRHDAVNAMLLNEFLKEHGKVQDQQANIEDLKSIAARQEAVIRKPAEANRCSYLQRAEGDCAYGVSRK